MTQAVQYWRSVLKRVFNVVVFISERGLAFRRSDEVIGSVNSGNYLGLLELLAQYDDFLAQHLWEHGGRGSGHTSYLSSAICEEAISSMSARLLQEIMSRIKMSKYYSVSLDSTPDEGHIDQLTLVFRYIEGSSPVEGFVTFMPNRGHKALDMFNALHEFLESHEIDIQDCRGQSYDNASSMSGKYNGMQALVLQRNPHALWVPCAGHSLNLVGKTAAESCLSATSFFDFLQQMYFSRCRHIVIRYWFPSCSRPRRRSMFPRNFLKRDSHVEHMQLVRCRADFVKSKKLCLLRKRLLCVPRLTVFTIECPR